MSKQRESKRLRSITSWLKKEKNTKIKENVADSNSIPYRRSTRNHKSDEKLPKETPVVKIENLSPITFKGIINYVSDFYDCAKVCDILLTEVENKTDSIVPVGFDLEWPFNFQTGSGKTALAQICLSNTVCYLLHLYNIPKLPASFIALLSHSKVKLVGVNIKNDIWKLTRDFKEFPGQKVIDNNCLDCGTYANKVFNRSCRWSLERLTAYLLEKRIDKDPSIRRSKWHIHPLNSAQKLYAATDAFVSLLLHLRIEEKNNILKQVKEVTEFEF